MERINKREKSFKKIFNRLFSYLFLIISIFLLFYSSSRVYEYIALKKEQTNLNEVLEDLKSENRRLKEINSKLSDDDYMSFFVKGKYQLGEDGKVSRVID